MPSIFSLQSKTTLPLPPGQSFVPSIFPLLWEKDRETVEGAKLRLPNTIIFHAGHIVAWYFTSKDGYLKKKNKDKLNRRHIVNEFPKKQTRKTSEIVAYFVRPKGEEFDNADVEYFDQVSFCSFIDHALTKVDEGLYGLLQEFVEPDLEHNSVTRAQWMSAGGMRVETRTNINRISANAKQKHERVATFDGPEYFSHARVWAAPAIIKKIGDICDRIIEHIMKVDKEREYEEIKMMEALFKISDGKIYFLFPTAMHLTKDKVTATKDPIVYRADTSASFFFRLTCDRVGRVERPNEFSFSSFHEHRSQSLSSNGQRSFMDDADQSGYGRKGRSSHASRVDQKLVKEREIERELEEQATLAQLRRPTYACRARTVMSHQEKISANPYMNPHYDVHSAGYAVERVGAQSTKESANNAESRETCSVFGVPGIEEGSLLHRRMVEHERDFANTTVPFLPALSPPFSGSHTVSYSRNPSLEGSRTVSLKQERGIVNRLHRRPGWASRQLFCHPLAIAGEPRLTHVLPDSASAAAAAAETPQQTRHSYTKGISEEDGRMAEGSYKPDLLDFVEHENTQWRRTQAHVQDFNRRALSPLLASEEENSAIYYFRRGKVKESSRFDDGRRLLGGDKSPYKVNLVKCLDSAPGLWADGEVPRRAEEARKGNISRGSGSEGPVSGSESGWQGHTEKEQSSIALPSGEESHDGAQQEVEPTE